MADQWRIGQGRRRCSAPVFQAFVNLETIRFELWEDLILEYIAILIISTVCMLLICFICFRKIKTHTNFINIVLNFM